MGCMAAPEGHSTQTKQQQQVSNIMNQMMENQAKMVGQLSAVPRQLPTGDILIPMNYMSGEFPTTYPMWIEQNGVSKQIYSQFIQELNSTTMPIFIEQRQLQTNMMSNMTLINKPMQNAQQIQTNMMNQVGQIQMQQMQIQQKLVTNTDNLLLKYNQTVFEKCGLQVISSLPGVAMTNASQVGVIIKKIQQQVVYVVQPQPQPEQNVSENNINEGLPSYQEVQPLQYTNQ